ncbi:MAG: hypothetical protein V1729_01040 [Candidatus Woesearchaeota archaeon]
MGDAKTTRYTSRILVVGKSISPENIDDYIQVNDGIAVDIMNDFDSDLPGDRKYNVILLEQIPPQELILKLNAHSPGASHMSLGAAKDPRSLQAIHSGIHAFVAYEEENQSTSAEIRYAVLKKENVETIRAVGEHMQQMQKVPEFNGLESHINRILGDDGPELTAEQLADMGNKCPDDRKKMAALSKQAINAAKEYDIESALDFVESARAVDYQNERIPDLLWSVISDFVMIDRVVEAQHRIYADILRNDSSSIKKEVLLQVERTAPQLPVIKEIRPSRSRLSVVTVSDLECYRREDPDKQAIIREARTHRYFKRLQRRVKKGQNMINTPDIIGVVRVPDESREAWALYREYVEGDTVLDVLRDQLHSLERARANNQPRKTTKMRSSIISLMMNAAQQCAYSSAYGPIKLALGTQDHLETYYNQRMKKRIPDSFDKLFDAANIACLDKDEREALVNTMQPIHERLAALPNAFYGDAWYGNSLITEKRENMILLDFFGARRLPAVIDLATLICYGGFANKLSMRRDTTERNLVETFFNTYNSALVHFNEIVSGYNKNPRNFIRDEIARDAETFPEGEREAILHLLKMTDRTRFEKGHGAYAGLKKRVWEGKLRVSTNYIDDLEQYAKNMKVNKHAREYEVGNAEYKQALEIFRTDYYCALVHRSLLLGATFCEYAAERVENLDKKYRLIGEVNGTLGNAERGVNKLSPKVNTEGVMSEENNEALLKSIQRISGKVTAINKNFYKIFDNKEKDKKE